MIQLYLNHCLVERKKEQDDIEVLKGKKINLDVIDARLYRQIFMCQYIKYFSNFIL